MAKNEEQQFRLRPRKPTARNERANWALAYKAVMHYARASRSIRRRLSLGARRPNGTRRYHQRCAVRVSYTKNASPGQWRAHGCYLTRESATRGQDSHQVGFDGQHESTDPAARLEKWQKTGDERLWKLIISPEFGERIDLQRLTRDLLSQMEKDIGTPLEWVAVAHFNTEHPHVHVALRGVGAEGHPFQLSRDYVQQGIRNVAEDCCTRQLGYRTELDADQASRREVSEYRYTSLDRIIKHDATEDAGKQTLTVSKYQHIRARLIFLETLGLAERTEPNVWTLRTDFEEVLRAIQRSADRQKTLAAHGVLMSDERLPMTVLDLRRLTTLEGRILVHGEEDAGRSYLMLEGTDGQVHYICYTPEIEAARHRGGLRTNSYIRLRRMFLDGRPALSIDDLGDSEAILHNKRFLRDASQRLIRRGVLPEQSGWNGWLGRYQKAIQEAVTLERSTSDAERHQTRNRGR